MTQLLDEPLQLFVDAKPLECVQRVSQVRTIEQMVIMNRHRLSERADPLLGRDPSVVMEWIVVRDGKLLDHRTETAHCRRQHRLLHEENSPIWLDP